MRKITILVLILIVVAFTLTSLKTPSNTPDTTSSPAGEVQVPKAEIIAQGLEVPWALAFLPDDNILVTERVGRVRLIQNGQLLEKPIATLNVKQSGESGLHGIAIHPNFPQKPYIYLYYTYSTNGNDSLNRVSSFVFDGQTLTDEKIIVDKIPGAIFHDGGRIKFGPASPQGGPDRLLYVTTGDALNPSLAQDKNSLAGKILRVNTEEKVEIYSYGHRNPQGIAWDNQDRLWETEHGESATDEINLMEAGKNYGWPTIRGNQTRAGMLAPVLQSGTQTWAPAGIAFYNGSLFFGGLRGQALFELNLQSLKLKEHFKNEFGRIRDVVLGPDNILYITTSNRDGRGNPSADDDKIIRINPSSVYVN